MVDDLLSFGLPPRDAGHPAPARHRRPVLRLSHEAARVPGPLPRRLPPWRRGAGGSRPPDRAPDAEARLDGAERNHRLLRAGTAVSGACSPAPSSAPSSPRLLDGITIVILIPLLKHLFGTTGAAARRRHAARALAHRLPSRRSSPERRPARRWRAWPSCSAWASCSRTSLSYALVAVQHPGAGGTGRDLRRKLYDHLLQLDLGFFQRTRTGLLVDGLINETDQAKGIVTASMVSLIRNLVPAGHDAVHPERASRSA